MLHTNRHLHSGWIHSHDTASVSQTFDHFEARFAVLVLLFAKVLTVLMLLMGLLMLTSSRVSGNSQTMQYRDLIASETNAFPSLGS
jgi:hypothetical protein